jgi:hypothetical protein
MPEWLGYVAIYLGIAVFQALLAALTLTAIAHVDRPQRMLVRAWATLTVPIFIGILIPVGVLVVI